MIQNIFYGYVKEFYLHFYRIPLFDEAGKLLAPFALAKSLMGTGIYDCKEVWEYEPKGSAVLAAFLWAGVFLTLALLVHKERKTEKTGRAFVSAWAERVVEGAVSLLAGMGFGILLLDMTQVKEYGIAAEVLVIGVCGIVGAWRTFAHRVSGLDTGEWALEEKMADVCGKRVCVCGRMHVPGQQDGL